MLMCCEATKTRFPNCKKVVHELSTRDGNFLMILSHCHGSDRAREASSDGT